MFLKMDIPFVIIVTSQKCSHCVKFRGPNGKPDNSREWSPKLINKLLTGKENPTGNPNAISRVIEINLENMDTDASSIHQVNEYIFYDNNLERHIYTKNGKEIKYDVEINGNRDTQKSELLKSEYNIQYFNQWLTSNIPIKILDLVCMFPTWIFVSSKNWTKSVQNQSPIYGVVSSCKVVKDQYGNYSSEIEGTENPSQTFQRILRNPSLLQ